MKTEEYKDAVLGLFGEIEAQYGSVRQFCIKHNFVEETLSRNKRFKQHISVNAFNRISDILQKKELTPDAYNTNAITLYEYLVIDNNKTLSNVLKWIMA